MTEQEIAILEAENTLYKTVIAKVQSLYQANDRLMSGEIDQLAADFNFTQEQIDGWTNKIAQEKQNLIFELLAIYNAYVNSQTPQDPQG